MTKKPTLWKGGVLQKATFSKDLKGTRLLQKRKVTLELGLFGMPRRKQTTTMVACKNTMGVKCAEAYSILIIRSCLKVAWQSFTGAWILMAAGKVSRRPIFVTVIAVDHGTNRMLVVQILTGHLNGSDVVG